jgi:hypothetical protein
VQEAEGCGRKRMVEPHSTTVTEATEGPDITGRQISRVWTFTKGEGPRLSFQLVFNTQRPRADSLASNMRFKLQREQTALNLAFKRKLGWGTWGLGKECGLFVCLNTIIDVIGFCIVHCL